jgi:hypothetical protein
MTGEIRALIALLGATVLALYAAPRRGALATIAIIILFASIFWIATAPAPALPVLIEAQSTSTCPTCDCPHTCGKQTMENPFFNPGLMDFGTSRLYTFDCPLKTSDSLMAAREKAGGVRFAEQHRFYHVPSPDSSDMRQWLYEMPDNCKHNQAACRAGPTIIDLNRWDAVGATSSQ